MALSITTSLDISTLDFTVLYDISGATPTITLTNTSTGPDLASCTWWYTITTPSGAPIHTGSETSPDKTGVWSSLVVPDTWPEPFGNSPYGQIEFSCGVPYVTTLYVKDGVGSTFSLVISNTICRPNGNNQNTVGNFGLATFGANVNCGNAQILSNDTTNYAYQSLLTGTNQTSRWTLVYPLDSNGNQPANNVVENAANVFFPVGYSGAGYQLNLNTFSTYNMGNGGFIKIQYKGVKTFGVYCNVDLCKLRCEMNTMYELSKKSCGTVEDVTLKDKMIKINFLFSQVISGILQPLCGIDVPAIIKEIEKVGGFNSDCCCSSGINASSASTASGGCCPKSLAIYTQGGTVTPSNCESGSYFPVIVYEPNGTTPIGTAYNMTDVISFINGNTAWNLYGTAFNEGNCKVGFFPAMGVPTVPPVIISASIPSIPSDDLIVVDVKTHNTTSTPAGCPGTYFPAAVYDPTDTTVIGTANNAAEIIAIINSNSAWAAYGTAVEVVNCTVKFLPASGVTSIPNVKVNPGSSSGSTVTPAPPIITPTYEQGTTAEPTACPGSFYPANVFEPDGTTLIGSANSIDDLISLLNGNAEWQAYGVASSNGNCSVIWLPAIGVVTIPPVVVESTGNDTLPGPVVLSVPIYTHNTDTPPAACPSSFFPVRVYNVDDTAVIGIAIDMVGLLSILNSDPEWSALGTAFSLGSCVVGFYPADGVINIPDVHVDTDTTNTDCTDGVSLYEVPIVDLCSGVPITSGDFPSTYYVNYLGTSNPVSLGIINNYTELIDALNAEDDKPASVTYLPGSSSGALSVIVVNDDCDGVSPGVITINGTSLSSMGVLFYGGNHRFTNDTTYAAVKSSIDGLDMPTMDYLGSVCGISQTNHHWHSILVGTNMYVNEPQTGKVYVFDMTNPIAPSLSATIQLSTVVAGPSGNFTGNPKIGGGTIPCFFNMYFPTDCFSGKNLIVTEASTGTLWAIDMSTNTENYAFQDNKLRGKCPRCCVNNILYFSQDGYMETSGGSASGVNPGDIVKYDMAVYNATGLSTITVSPSQHYVYSATYDGYGNIYFVTALGAICKFVVSSGAVTEYLAEMAETYTTYQNSKVYVTDSTTALMYVCNNTQAGAGTKFINVLNLPSATPTTFQPIILPGGVDANKRHWNVREIPGKCLLALTMEIRVISPTQENASGVGIFTKQGVYLGQITHLDHVQYNVIPFNVATTSGNTLCSTT